MLRLWESEPSVLPAFCCLPSARAQIVARRADLWVRRPDGTAGHQWQLRGGGALPPAPASRPHSARQVGTWHKHQDSHNTVFPEKKFSLAVRKTRNRLLQREKGKNFFRLQAQASVSIGNGRRQCEHVLGATAARCTPTRPPSPQEEGRCCLQPQSGPGWRLSAIFRSHLLLRSRKDWKQLSRSTYSEVGGQKQDLGRAALSQNRPCLGRSGGRRAPAPPGRHEKHRGYRLVTSVQRQGGLPPSSQQ